MWVRTVPCRLALSSKMACITLAIRLTSHMCRVAAHGIHTQYIGQDVCTFDRVYRVHAWYLATLHMCAPVGGCVVCLDSATEPLYAWTVPQSRCMPGQCHRAAVCLDSATEPLCAWTVPQSRCVPGQCHRAAYTLCMLPKGIQ